MMKKITVVAMLWSMACVAIAQQYDVEKLNSIAKIWGETYLFHPAIIRSDMKVSWEKNLVEFLPDIVGDMPADSFISAVNSKLLQPLNDPFTRLYNNVQQAEYKYSSIFDVDEFDWVTLTAEMLTDVEQIVPLMERLCDGDSIKPLVIDMRVGSKFILDPHGNTMFGYVASMLIEQPIPMSQLVQREHLGWDEYNDWWNYEQRWKVSFQDRQVLGNGRLFSLPYYSAELRQKIPDLDMNDFNVIKRPVYFLTNNATLSNYYPLLMSLRLHRSNTYIFNDNSGPLVEDELMPLRHYSLPGMTFVMNPVVCINSGKIVPLPDLSGKNINCGNIQEFIRKKQHSIKGSKVFPWDIRASEYLATGNTLSVEEKILGVMKVYTVVKYFYPFPERIRGVWDDILKYYLLVSQQTDSDADYYHMVERMMATLNDSHVSTFHSSIMDFSKIFVVPAKMEWIEEEAVITAVDTSMHNLLLSGDVILSVDGISFNELLEQESKKISCSNRQGLLAVVVNMAYFTGEQGSDVALEVMRNQRTKILRVERSAFVFHMMGLGDERISSGVLKGNVGYLNLSFLTDTEVLEKTLMDMKDTQGLILDLRNGYPAADFHHFLSMLAQEAWCLRRDAVPVVSAGNDQNRVMALSKINIVPDTDFVYNKPIAVLIDKTMISRPEDIAIALSAFDNVTFVGERTQGTDGEMTRIHLPGGGETSFTGQVIKFGDGTPFQGRGIVPDIEVVRSIKGVKEQRDEILDSALKFLNR